MTVLHIPEIESEKKEGRRALVKLFLMKELLCAWTRKDTIIIPLDIEFETSPRSGMAWRCYL